MKTELILEPFLQDARQNCVDCLIKENMEHFKRTQRSHNIILKMSRIQLKKKIINNMQETRRTWSTLKRKDNYHMPTPR